ncbi:MAG TPA: hypothetical protein VGK22_10675 [Candidatus Angelobacter sp.]|jgi:hypothetical protein
MDYTSGKSNLSARVRHTLNDLAAIRESLLAISDQTITSSDSQGHVLDLELAGELKNVVDALRLLLWAYIQALSVKSGRAPEEVLSWYKMELAVEMLRSASGRPGLARAGTIADFERMVNQTLSAAAKVPYSDRTQ